ncbi:unnamed protein product, partial [Linum tenue]
WEECGGLSAAYRMAVAAVMVSHHSPPLNILPPPLSSSSSSAAAVVQASKAKIRKNIISFIALLLLLPSQFTGRDLTSEHPLPSISFSIHSLQQLQQQQQQEEGKKPSAGHRRKMDSSSCRRQCGGGGGAALLSHHRYHLLLLLLCFNLLSSSSSSAAAAMEKTSRHLLSSIPSSWPSVDGGFASGAIDLGGGLHVFQTASFNKIWSTQQGGPDNLGASFFEPTQLPPDFHMLGTHSQPNANPNAHGWILAGKDAAGDGGALKPPVDYTLVWTSSDTEKINQQGIAYFWLPVPPDGYRAVGHVITTSPDKPPLEKVRCVRSDLTDQCQADAWLWGPADAGDPDLTGFNVFNLGPGDGSAAGVSVGTFIAQSSGLPGDHPTLVACLKNQNSVDGSTSSSMPNLKQVEELFKRYAPWISLHPDEEFLPSSVDWFFSNGSLLYEKGKESNPTPIDPIGSNLPQGGSNDGAYWLDLPVDGSAKERVKKGQLAGVQVYLHAKPASGGTFTDLAVWVFYPFNGPGRAKVEFIKSIKLGKLGEHVGDWEHVTLRISNFNGLLQSVYFSQHSGGSWVGSADLEYRGGSRPVAYASLHGHAMYPHPGLVMLGSKDIGIRDDTATGGMVVDTAAGFAVVAAEYLGKDGVVEPPWLNYMREWGPKIDYDVDKELAKVRKLLPGTLKKEFDKMVRNLPKEVLGEEGPTGPKVKASWNGDEA